VTESDAKEPKTRVSRATRKRDSREAEEQNRHDDERIGGRLTALKAHANALTRQRERRKSNE
jgi:hypothetical protein